MAWHRRRRCPQSRPTWRRTSRHGGLPPTSRSGRCYQDDRDCGPDYLSREGFDPATTSTSQLDSWRGRPQHRSTVGGRTSASLGEQPSGHSMGGGLLGRPPPITHQGMHLDHSFHSFDIGSGSGSHTCRHGSVPKMDFPKFNG